MSSALSDKQPPYSEEAERGVLGSILIDYRVLDITTDYKLTEQAFFVPAHRVVFQAAKELAEKMVSTDTITVSDHLKKSGALEMIGGISFLEQLVEDTPTATHSEYYIQIVSEKWRLRAIIQECRETEHICFGNKDLNADQIIATHAATIMEIEARQEQDEIPWSDTIKKSMVRIENILNSDDKLSGFSTGYQNIDRAVLGLKDRELTIIAARPSQGKTSLAMNIAEYVASGKLGSENIERAVGIFSLEMGKEELALRMKCARASMDNWKLMRGFIPKEDMINLQVAATELSKLPIYVDDRAALDIDQITIKARRWKKKYDIKLLVVDYLQLIHCMKKSKQGRQLEVSAISAQLKQIAKELGIPVIALSQLSRKPEDRKDGRPIVSDLRESGSIEQDADNIWLMHRPCNYPAHPKYEDETLAIVDIAKQRNGPTGEAKLNFRKEFTRFDDRIKDKEGEAGAQSTEREEMDIF